MSKITLKSELLSIFDIAEINLLMSIKGLSDEEARKKVLKEVNSILVIFLHCAKQLEKYLSKFTQEIIYPKGNASKLVENGYTLGQAIEGYLQISAEFVRRVHALEEEKLLEPIDKGEKLFKIIERVSLHFCGHMGQISLLRKLLDNSIEGGYTFIKAMSKLTRDKLRKEWKQWWLENKDFLI